MCVIGGGVVDLGPRFHGSPQVPSTVEPWTPLRRWWLPVMTMPRHHSPPQCRPSGLHPGSQPEPASSFQNAAGCLRTMPTLALVTTLVVTAGV